MKRQAVFLAAGGAALVLGVTVGVPLLAEQEASATSLDVCGALPVGSPLPDGSHLTAPQAANAAIIVAVAQQAGVGQVGAVDAVDAAMTESRLVNVNGGDRDSLGLFQERPSQGWGKPADIMNPAYAAGQFFDRLAALPGWQTMPAPQAAQAVERSGFPQRYQTWAQPAASLVAGLDGAGACTNAASAPIPGATTQVPAGFALPPGTPGPVVTAVAYALGQLGKPYEFGGTGPSAFDCSGLVMMAYRQASVTLPRTTYDQVTSGQPIYDPSTLAPGDLLFIEGSDPGPGGAPGHVGMYIGDGLVIDAPETGHPVELTPLASWTRQLVAMRRIV